MYNKQLKQDCFNHIYSLLQIIEKCTEIHERVEIHDRLKYKCKRQQKQLKSFCCRLHLYASIFNNTHVHTYHACYFVVARFGRTTNLYLLKCVSDLVVKNLTVDVVE